ncbi:MAG: efflux RND transporter periplasmic adaptor subunit [Calditrichia bacterium]
MKNLIWIAASIFFLTAFTGCSENSNAENPSSKTTIIPVKVHELEKKPFKEYLDATGTLEARNRIQILVEEGGTVEKVVRDKGRLAAKGDTLAILDNKILEAGYREAQAALRQAELDYNSKKVLYEKRAISENEFTAARYGLERAQAAYQLAEARYSKLFIIAPISGYVNDRFLDLGAYASPMTPIFDFIDNAYMKVQAGIAERFLNDIEIGTPAKITFDAYPQMELDSKVSYKNRSIDPQSRTFNIEIRIPNPDRKLAPQMVANVQLLRRSFTDIIVVPLDAVIETEQGRYVFVSDGGVAKKVMVDLQAVYQDSVFVNGLSSGQKLVVVGQQELTDGDSLELVN